MKDFFISYTKKDAKFATWVAELLERSGYTVIIQEWDFRPGDNLVANIHKALIECKKLIVILSEDYLKSGWCEAEWTSKYAEQMVLNEQRIVPIKIGPVNTRGLLSSLIYIDIVDKSEKDAESLILSGIRFSLDRVSDGFPSSYNLEHKSIDIDYIVDTSAITYVKTCTSRVMLSGTNKIHNRITWFSDESIDLVSLTKGVEIEHLNLRDTNYNYNVVFDHVLSRDEEISFSVKAILSNAHHHFSNFFSTEVIVPIKNLSMHLTLLDTSINKIYTQKISSSPMNKRTTLPEEHPFQSPYHWHLENPELNFEYKIFW